MKIRFDECVSYRVADAVRAFAANRPGFEVSHAAQAHAGHPDAQWMSSFAEAGGTAIVSGDYNILQNWPNLIAYRESKLIGFFPPPAFKALKGYGRAALLIRWWPAIVEKMKISSSGETWRWPMTWTPDVTKFEELRDPRFGKDGKIVPLAGNQPRSSRARRT